jgi:hypothetical protein
LRSITRALGIELRDLFYDTRSDPAAIRQARGQRAREAEERRLVDDAVVSAHRTLATLRQQDVSRMADDALDRLMHQLADCYDVLAATGELYREGAHG